MTDPRLTITDLSHDAGYWTARVHRNGESVQVDLRYGSWQALVPVPVRSVDGEGVVDVRRDVPRYVAEALAAYVRSVERRARRAA